MKQIWRLLWQTGILSAVYWGSEWAVRITGMPIPGNVLGIIVLFLLLATGVLKETYVNEAATFLLKHMVFFFVPIAVGLMNWGGVFYEYGGVLFLAVAASTALPLLATGFLAGALRRRVQDRETRQ